MAEKQPHKAHVIAVINNKGGVGKTTTAVQIAYGLAELKHKKTLIIDLDAQMNATQLLKIPANNSTCYEFILNKNCVPYAITDYLHAIAGNINMATFYENIDDMKGANTHVIKYALESVLPYYDYIILDTAPAMGTIMLNYLIAADSILIVAISELLAMTGVENITRLASGLRNNPKLADVNVRTCGMLLTMYDRRRRIHKDIEDYARMKYGEIVFNTKIRRNSALCDIAALGKSIYEYAPNCYAAQDYAAAIDEMLKRVKNYK